MSNNVAWLPQPGAAPLSGRLHKEAQRRDHRFPNAAVFFTPAAHVYGFCRIIWNTVSAASDRSAGRRQASTEPWFNIPYVEARLPAELLSAWRSAAAEGSGLALPRRNEYIATDLSLCCDAGAKPLRSAVSNGGLRSLRSAMSGSGMVRRAPAARLRWWCMPPRAVNKLCGRC
jgi:hypothetical protein